MQTEKMPIVVTRFGKYLFLVGPGKSLRVHLEYTHIVRALMCLWLYGRRLGSIGLDRAISLVPHILYTRIYDRSTHLSDSIVARTPTGSSGQRVACAE